MLSRFLYAPLVYLCINSLEISSPFLCLSLIGQSFHWSENFKLDDVENRYEKGEISHDISVHIRAQRHWKAKIEMVITFNAYMRKISCFHFEAVENWNRIYFRNEIVSTLNSELLFKLWLSQKPCRWSTKRVTPERYWIINLYSSLHMKKSHNFTMGKRFAMC